MVVSVTLIFLLVTRQYFSSGSVGKESTCNARDTGYMGWIRKIPRRRKWQPTLVFLPEKSNGQRNLAGDSAWGHKEWDTTAHMHRLGFTG